MLASELLFALQAGFPPERLFTDPVDCYAYAYDNSRNFRQPQVVVFPLTISEVQSVVRLCHQHHVPVVARGRGTGTAGGSVPEQGGVALSLERMNRLLKETFVFPYARVVHSIYNAKP